MGQEQLKDLFKQSMQPPAQNWTSGDLVDLMSMANPIGVEINWQELFAKFCQRHGDPVPFGNRLLFPDGFQHSATSHQGPVYPPPADPQALAALKAKYKEIRRQILVRQFAELENTVWRLQQLAAEREDTLGVDWEGLESRLEWLRSELDKEQ